MAARSRDCARPGLIVSMTVCALLCASAHARTLSAVAMKPVTDGSNSTSVAGYVSGPAELKGRVSSDGKLVLQRVREAFQPKYRLATRDEARTAKHDVQEVMPEWEIAYVADGWVDGVFYGSNSGPPNATKNGLQDKLGIQDPSIPEPNEPGLDIVVNFSSPAEACLAPALAIFDQGPWNSNDVSSPEDLQNIQQLVDRWDLDLLNYGWDPVAVFTGDKYQASIKSDAKREDQCQRLNKTSAASKCPCTTDFYLLVIEDAGAGLNSTQAYARVLVPVDRNIGAGAIQKAVMQSFENRGVGMLVSPSTGLAQSYRSVLLVRPEDADKNTDFGVV